jgi:DNA-binding winged helix-turn-helix (wHTH) protein
MTDIRSGSGYWAGFPATYRAEQIATITQWLAVGESGLIIGGSGVGKSNFAGFLSSRPEVIPAQFRQPPARYCFLLLDLNSLPGLNGPNFYRGLYQTLQDASEQLEAEVRQAVRELNSEPVNWDDSFAVLTLLQKAHRLFIRQAGKKVVWLLDRFDEACRRLDAPTLNSLRGLRDQFKGELIYLVFTRQPLARLCPLAEIDEFYEIVAANTCWLGPMVERDARWLVQQMADRLQTTFDESTITQLIGMTGGLPAFLKGACLAVANGSLGSTQSNQAWIAHLLSRPEFQRNCQEIWRDLTPGEQQVLSALSGGTGESALAKDTLAYLEKYGWLTRTAPEGKLNLFSPLFRAYVSQQYGLGAGLIELHPKTRAVLRGGVALNIELTASEDRLLAYFLEHPAEVCDKDTLMRAVWPNEQRFSGIRDDRLAQLVKRLRDKIEPDPAHPAYIQTVHGRGYRFIQPGSD